MGKMTDLNAALDKFKTSDNNSFFGLKNDKDAAEVRILVGEELVKDEDWFVVHEVEINGKKRWVQCTEEGDCPLCVSGNKPQLKLFLQLVDKRDGKVKTWERGQKFIPKIIGMINKYGSLAARPFEIERHGKAGSTDTTYEVYPLDKDGKTLKDFPDKQELLGESGFILQKSASDMQRIADGKFKPEETKVDTPPRERRRSPEGGEVF